MKLVYVIGVMLIAFLSILTGVVIGISSSKEIFESMELIQTLSSIGTLVVTSFAACIAFSALYTWKVQFDHVEKFKALVALEVELRELFFTFDKYLSSYIQKVVHCDKTANYELNKNDYDSNICKFSRSLDFVSSFLSEDESKKLSIQYDITTKLFSSAIDMADSNHRNMKASQFGVMRRQKDKDIEEQYIVFKDMLRSTRR